MEPHTRRTPAAGRGSIRSAATGIDGSQSTTRTRRPKVTYRCTLGHVIEAGRELTSCPGYIGGRPCPGELKR